MSEESDRKEKPSGLEDLERRLYSRTPPPLRHDEEGIASEKHIRIAPGWTEEEERSEGMFYGIFARIMPTIKRLFIASIIFFLFAAGVALYGFWRGGNTVSPQKIALSVIGPVSAPAGEELAFEILVENGNDLPLAAADLLIEYPEGARKGDDLSEPLARYREALGEVAPGGSVSRRLAFVPFGEEGEAKEVRVTVEYRPKGGSAIFHQTAAYQFRLSSAPVTVTVSAPKEANAGGRFEIALEIVSNSSAAIEHLIVKAEYPAGFIFEDSSPAPAFAKDTWQLGDLAPHSSRTVRFAGRIEAAEEEERTVRIFVGTAHPKDEKALGTIYLTERVSLVVRKPFISLALSLNGERGKTFVARSGQTVRADILWANNLTVKIADMGVTAKLDGEVYNPSSVVSGSGAYDSTTGTVSWDARNDPRFVSVEPGEGGTVSFSFIILPVATDPARFKNPSATLHLFARGKRLDEEGGRENVLSTLSAEIKVASQLSLVSRLLYAGGPFVNSGPLPPKAGEETTYTVVWSLSNSSNGVSEARISAIIPPYVRWVGQVSPPSEKVSYSSVGGEVAWEAGEIAPGVGFGSSPREVSFQLSLRPSQGQVRTAPAILGDAAAEGFDRFTGTTIRSNIRPALTTASLSDAGADAESGKVVK